MKLTVLSPGPLSTIQDEGRFGAMDTGFSPGGAMDCESMALANLLVGNVPGAGVIEMTMAGLSARFDCTCVIALTGADMFPKRNGRDLALYRAVEMHPGDELTMGAAKRGMRGYLAVAGGFDLPMVMGSQSTNLKCGLGGFQGRKLRSGDELPLNQSIPLSALGDRSLAPRNHYPAEITLRVILGPQADFFTDRGIAAFLGSTYTISEKSDRMGIRLEGAKIENRNGVDILSDGIAAGSVQIPAAGTPIIMMADRQTTGGYAKIATVISADLKKAAQARPGSRVRFEKVTLAEGVRLRREETRRLRQTEYELLSWL